MDRTGDPCASSGVRPFYSPQKVFIYPAWRFWHSKTTFFEKPAPKCDLLIPDHPAVDTWVRWFSEKNHSSFQTQLDRARFYAAPAQEIFVRKGLPKDLIYVALVESGFSPTARSHANAVGMWQIVPKTGNRFGLEQNKWVDERRHPMKAAKAAANYLSLLYNQFGSWSLALAAYNAGENAVQGALDKSGLKTFWDLMENGYLPAETRDYVPKVFAAVKIIRNPDLYGFRLDSEHFIALHETVIVPGGLKLSWVGKQIGVPEEILQSSNPELCRSITPPGCSKYELSLPIGTGDDLLTALARHPQREEKPVGKAAAVPKSSAFTFVQGKIRGYIVQHCREAQMFRHRSGCSKWHEAFAASQDRAGFETSRRGVIAISIKGPDKTWKREYLYLQFLLTRRKPPSLMNIESFRSRVD